MATTNLGLDELTGSEKLKTFPTLFNGDMETIDAAFGAAFGGSNKTVNQVLNAMQDGMAIVANGNSHGYIAAGQYVYVKNHGSLADGLYVSTAVIEANATLSGSNLTADAKGGLNALNSKIGGGMLTGGEPTEIEENEDLNNRKVPGVYLIRSGTVYGTLTNAPTLPDSPYQARLIVFPSGFYDSGNITNGGQILWNNNGHIAYRTYTGSFGSWQLITSSISRVKVNKDITISSDNGWVKMCTYEQIGLAFNKVLSVDFCGWEGNAATGIRQVEAYSDGIYIYSTKAIESLNVEVIVTYTKNKILIDSDISL